MSTEISELFGEIEIITGALGALGSALRKTAGEAESGHPPPRDLARTIEQVADAFESAHGRISELSQRLAVGAPAFASVSGLRSSLEAISHVVNTNAEARRATLQLLGKATALRSTTAAPVPGLSVVHERARSLRDQLLSARTQADANGPQGHLEAIGALIRLVEVGSNLADAEWAELQESVRASFGLEIAAAAGRGRLVLELAQAEAPTLETKGPDPAEPRIEAARGHESAKTPEVASDAKAPPTASEVVVLVDSALVSDVSSPPVVATSSEGLTQPPQAIPESFGRPSSPQLAPPSIEIEEPSSAGVHREPATTEPIQASRRALASEPTEEPRTTSPPSDDKRVDAPTAAAGFPVKARAADIANLMLTKDRKSWPSMASELIWRLVGEDRAALAYHLARCLEDESPTEVTGLLPSPLLRALVVSPVAEPAAHDTTTDLAQSFAALTPLVDELHSAGIEGEAKRLLVMSVAARPALLAPGTKAGGVLESVGDLQTCPAFGDLADAVLDYTRLGLELSHGVLKGVREHVAWEEELEKKRIACEEWVSSMRSANIKFHAATKVLHDWVDDKGWLSEPLAIILGDVRERRSELTRFLSSQRDSRTQERQIDATDRKLRGRKADLRPIDGAARKDLLAWADDGFAKFESWLQELAAEPGIAMTDYRYKQADVCRQKLLRSCTAARQQLDAAADQLLSSAPGRAAAAHARRVLDHFEQLLDPHQPEPRRRSLRHVLGAELLRLPGIELSETWEPDGETASTSLIQELIGLAAMPDHGWHAQAFQAQCGAKDHANTERIIELARVTDDDVADLVRSRERELETCRDELRNALTEARADVERAVLNDLLSESERQQLMSIIDGYASRPVVRFAPAHAELAEVRQKIQSKMNELREREASRLRSSGLDGTRPEDYERIKKLINTGQIITAREYIELAAKGEQLPEERRRDGREFFPDFAREMSDYLERPEPRSTRSVIEGIRQFRTQGPLTMKGVAGSQAEDAAKMLESWYEAKRDRARARDKIADIFARIGFEGVKVEDLHAKSDPGDWARWSLTAKGLNRREQCVYSRYGSEAKGRYLAFGVWDRPSADEITVRVAEEAKVSPVFVLFFGRMNEVARRELASLCRERRSTFIVIDELLMLFLAGVRGLRLPVLFETALQFTFAEPYTATAGLVPPEMFYGREHARDSIFEPQGTNLVYGGRQLGKTALLRHVERTLQKPEAGILIKWIDLKAENIALGRPIDDIWSLLTNVLREWGVTRSANITYETLSRHLEDWLGQSPSRRIILLLDEADAFLDADARNRYGHVERLKGLMDRTDRRFKVVFAGLHNVQRTSRDANTPLAHFGAAWCIGPLLESGEWRSAMELVTRPLSAMGFRFESEDLPMRILSHANYYPSLIQLFCTRLLSYLTTQRRFDYRSTPPYVITARHIDEAYRSKELRMAITDRFHWTLDLDPRYRLIALRLALESSDHPERLRSGFDVEWVRGEAIQLWKEGFRGDTSLEAFRTILEEMIGLGILRAVEHHRFALRNSNVLTLLGTHTEIEDALIDAMNRQAQPEYEPETFRRADKDDARLRSPLTARQESLIFARQNGVIALFGSQLGGLDQLGRFLRLACDVDRFFEPIPDLQTKADFQRRLKELISGRREGLTIIYVDAQLPWSVDWIREALSQLRSLQAKSKHVRVVFAGDPRQCWEATEPSLDEFFADSQEAMTTGTLVPWTDTFVRRWLEDIHFGNDSQELRQKLQALTGNWGRLLLEAIRSCEHAPHTWKERLETFRRPAFALDPPEPAMHVLNVMSVIAEPLDEDDLTMHAECPAELVRHVIRWGDMLGYLRPADRGRWELDPIVASALSR